MKRKLDVINNSVDEASFATLVREFPERFDFGYNKPNPRPCLETRAITLAHAGTRANYFACVIYRTRKIASNVFFLLLLF